MLLTLSNQSWSRTIFKICFLDLILTLVFHPTVTSSRDRRVLQFIAVRSLLSKKDHRVRL